MEKVKLISKEGATADIFVHGAHVSSWAPVDGKEQIFLSQKSFFQEGIAIRGGVPIIFPQFASLGSLPKHGFARNAMWTLQSTGLLSDGAAFARFSLKENMERLLIWPHVFTLEFQVTLTSQDLLLELLVSNHGDTHFHFTAALHTYFQVNNIDQVRILGLGGLHYRDTVHHSQDGVQAQDVLLIDQEIDRIYANTKNTIVIDQAHQQLQMSQTGFQDAVVWNPGKEKAAQLNDLVPHEYQQFVCIEAAAIMQSVSLKPRESWKGCQKLVHIAK